MPNNELINIIQICLDMEKLAMQTYAQFADHTGEGLKQFWQQMSREEQGHVSFWEKLGKLAEDGILPPVFDDPERVRKELETSRSRVLQAITSADSITDISRAFFLAFRLEFYLLHPAFATLFHFIPVVDKVKSPADEYDRHINEFIDALNSAARGAVSPEMELFGEMLQRLWTDNKKLISLSTTDELTGVLNRRGFQNIVVTMSHFAQRQNATVGLMMIDLDHFKKVNDTYGHKKGDEVLKNVAQVLKHKLRVSDIIGRYGGEEFVVFLPSVTREAIGALTESLRSAVEQETSRELRVTVSIGAATGPLSKNIDQDVRNYLLKADSSAYEAKNQGRNRVIIAD